MHNKKSKGFIYDVIGVGIFIALIFALLFSIFPSPFSYLRYRWWSEQERTYPETVVGAEAETVESLTPEEEDRARQRQEERERAQQQIEQREKEQLEAILKAERESEQASREQAELNNTWDIGEDPSTVEGAFGAVYSEIFEPAGDIYECRYNAKGNWYIILSPGSVVLDGETKPRDTVRTLVYDRESKNGACNLIVYYEEILNEDSSEYTAVIRNTYAVKMSDGTVIPSGKHAWADVGNALYQEATGEK
ncbi:MAG: hypothetical protein J1E64_04975 [Acetatifactor sp.]|nr:hypothetical protein [Acetatifactor sp.]